jgi:molybdopterin molybdotransferase
MASRSVEALSLATPQGGSTPDGSAVLSVEEARSRIIEAIRPLSGQTIKLGSALGRALAEDVVASRAHPPEAVAAMDGYALRSADALSLPVKLKRVGTSKAGARFEGKVSVGNCVRIFTGAIFPDGADTIALQEDASELGDDVEIIQVPEPGRHIRAAGTNYSAGQLCLAKGRVLTARDIGVIASCGYAHVPVCRKPRIAILGTGDELVDPGGSPGPDQIFGSNNAAIAAAVAAWGGEPVDLGIAPDRIEAIAGAIDAAIGADLLVTSAGASVGEHDLVRNALATRGFTPDFWKIAMRPGKPVIFGMIGEMPVLGMSGNPVSALVSALMFLRPAIRAMLGLPAKQTIFEQAVLGAAMRENHLREDFVRARIERGSDGKLIAVPFPTQDSAMLVTLAHADGLIRRRPHAPPAPEGTMIDVIVFDHLGSPF